MEKAIRGGSKFFPKCFVFINCLYCDTYTMLPFVFVCWIHICICGLHFNCLPHAPHYVVFVLVCFILFVFMFCICICIGTTFVAYQGSFSCHSSLIVCLVPLIRLCHLFRLSNELVLIKTLKTIPNYTKLYPTANNNKPSQVITS